MFVPPSVYSRVRRTKHSLIFCGFCEKCSFLQQGHKFRCALPTGRIPPTEIGITSSRLQNPHRGCLQESSQNTACRAASPRRNEGVTGNENPGCLSSSSSSSSSSSEIEYDDEDEPSRQLEVMDEEKGVDARDQGQREASVWVCGCVGARSAFQHFSFSLQPRASCRVT